ncbi:hypothetical protein CLHUN_42170 [Ruminiclostridium hungatei]|uniref:Uncharacterized protein n=1 Tax=Ruminiclostridium hungatei TaxID=48256 RepID=A0A1V4SDU5_RUMHU|nr:hypothetical protein [Ruminiclostridium hungatei]OPX41903.1 hypothetical protein CLHUN_42170 [Ruminiclostridium hungatei]
MKTSFNKKILIIILILIGIITYVFWYIFCPNDGNEQIEVKKYEVVTSLNDKFFVSEKLVSKFPDFTYNVDIFNYSSNKKELILSIENVENIEDEKINVLYSSSNIKAYLYWRYILIKERASESFKSISILEFEKLDINENKYLIPIAKEILYKNWGAAHFISEFLIKSNDSDAINTIKRYAKGEFTSEEIENNEYSGYSKDEMKEYFKGLLIKYNLQN